LNQAQCVRSRPDTGASPVQMKWDYVFFSESVTEGHPDKLCDQISDAIVDRYLEEDPTSVIVAECAVSTGIVFIAARFASDAVVDVSQIARRVISDVGYDQPDFNPRTCTVVTSLKELPREVRLPLDERQTFLEELDTIRARNAVTAFGFACDQTPTLMPAPIHLAHQLARRLTAARREKLLPHLMPDGSVQVGVEFRDRRPRRVHSVTIVTAENSPESFGLANSRFSSELREAVIEPVLKDGEVRADPDTQIYVNSEDAFLVGGPSLHPGLTGRKNAIDTYGGYSRHGGSALSGKDPSRIDRVAAYAARYAAKNVVAAGLATQCEVQLSYTIGQAHPVSLHVETFGTGSIDDANIASRLGKFFDFRLGGIVKEFQLRLLPSRVSGGFYQKLAAYGQMGRSDMELPWERTDKALSLGEFKA
jgi:S-adenosylmethionine synthetase